MKNKSVSEIDPQIAKKRKKRKKILIILAVLLLVIPAVTAAVGIGGFAIWANTQKIDESLLPTATAVPTYYDADGNVLPYSESNYVDASTVSDDLKYAFVALEDKRFYQHKGYDVKRMIGATFNNIKAGKIREGASTITQQLIKNTHLTHERTVSRKLKELALAIQLEKKYSKDEILSMYLSVIYFGSGAYGVKQAASMFFDKEIDDLTLAECATLAGIVRNPAGYSPLKKPEASLNRRNVVLGVMRDQGYIDDAEYENAKSQPIRTESAQVNSTDSKKLSAKMCEFYIAQAAKEVCDALDITKYQLSNSGLKIYTNLDRSLQQELEKQRLSADNFGAKDIESVSVIMDNASGAVLAYSSSYRYSVFRQAGSVMKPLAVYAPALDSKLISLATPVTDEKVDFGGFSPNNYGGIYYGDTTVREAIKKSMNSVSVKILDYLGVEKSTAYLKNFGITTVEDDKNYALALGATSKGVNPLEIAGGYAAIARGGEYISPSFVRFAVDNGNKVLSNENAGIYSGGKHGARVLSRSTASLITSALHDTVLDGTARTLSALPFEVASKTGTVERAGGGNSDAWNASYNGQFTVVVWHGTDGVMEEKGGGHPTRHALKLWQALDRQKSVDRLLSVYDGVEEVEIDTYSTNINRQIVKASENTPLEYRKTELFSFDDIPSCNGSKFDNVTPEDFDILNDNGVITISFDSEAIYSYELFRCDFEGSKQIYGGAGSGDRISVTDRPISFEGKVDYILVCHLKDNKSISSNTTRSVYIKDNIMQF